MLSNKYSFLILLLLPTLMLANKADALNVIAKCKEDRICSFDVTVKHADTGWKHFANKYEVVSLENKVIATRVLHHPHVKEQPFTRTLSNVRIPKTITQVKIRVHDSVHKLGGKEIRVSIP